MFVQAICQDRTTETNVIPLRRKERFKNNIKGRDWSRSPSGGKSITFFIRGGTAKRILSTHHEKQRDSEGRVATERAKCVLLSGEEVPLRKPYY